MNISWGKEKRKEWILSKWEGENNLFLTSYLASSFKIFPTSFNVPIRVICVCVHTWRILFLWSIPSIWQKEKNNKAPLDWQEELRKICPTTCSLPSRATSPLLCDCSLVTWEPFQPLHVPRSHASSHAAFLKWKSDPTLSHFFQGSPYSNVHTWKIYPWEIIYFEDIILLHHMCFLTWLFSFTIKIPRG